jgi:hypothetical protein
MGMVNAMTNLTNVMSLAFVNRSNANMTTAIPVHNKNNQIILEENDQKMGVN